MVLRAAVVLRNRRLSSGTDDGRTAKKPNGVPVTAAIWRNLSSVASRVKVSTSEIQGWLTPDTSANSFCVSPRMSRSVRRRSPGAAASILRSAFLLVLVGDLQLHALVRRFEL